MARIKPQTLLLQSKKKKGPARISATTIITCNLIAIFLALSVIATYWHWSRRVIKEQTSTHTFDLEGSSGDVKKYDLPGYAILNTSKGLITVELLKVLAPATVDKFLELTQKGLLDRMVIQRVIKHYAIQGGSQQPNIEEWTRPHAAAAAAYGLKYDAAFMIGTPRRTDRGGDDEFDIFITTAPIPNLNDKIIVFGKVIQGEDVVQEIEEVDTDEHYRPKYELLIHKVTLKQRVL